MDFGRLRDALAQLPDLIREPAANPTAAVILLAIVTVLLLIVVLLALLYISRKPPAVYRPQTISDIASEPVVGATESSPRETLRARAIPAALTVGVVVAAMSLIWVVAGVSTSKASVCLSCHADSPHAGLEDQDAHASTDCVGCHEPGSPLYKVTAGLPDRTLHVVLGFVRPNSVASYGIPVASEGCSGCHEEQIAQTTTNAELGIKVSHIEPLAAGAECVDCHALRDGVVSVRTVGHDPCLRCHGTAGVSEDCDVCHTGDPAGTTLAYDSARGVYAKRQITDLTCGGCHSQEKCDDCHGIRMPHSQAFKSYGHARIAAEYIWSGRLDVCETCHYKDHNECANCHSGVFPSHAPSFQYEHPSASASQCVCHINDDLVANPDRSFCDLCHEPSLQVDR